MTDSQSDITVALPPGSQAELRARATDGASPQTPTGAAERRSLGRYLVIDELGRGGMGLVLRAYDPKLQREVAIKVLRSGALDPTSEARMVHEARAMAKLSHPNVVPVYDVELGLESGVMVVMEYVPGYTLREWLTRPRGWAETVAAFVAAGRGLAAAHAKELLHRDFKPANVLMTDDGRIKVTDFGLAKFEGGSADTWESPGGYDSQAVLQTRAGTVMGTPRYMAPEQHAGADVDARTDQYAFCVAAWEALAGKPPFEGRDLQSYARSKLRGPGPWPKGRAVPGYVIRALLRGLSVEPGERWPSMNDLLDVLERTGERRRKGLAVAASLGVLSAALSWAWLAAPVAPCTGASAQIQEVWGAERRERLEEVLGSAEVPYAGLVRSRTVSRLGTYADGWVAEHTEACEATSLRKEQSPEAMDLRMACLKRAKLGLAAAIEQLSRGDAKTMVNAHKVVDALPSLDRCAEVEQLKAEVAPPAPAIEGEVDRVEAELARARALFSAGHYAETLELLPPIDREARATGYVPLLTRTLNLAGRAAGEAGRFAEAEEHLREGLRLALGSRDWGSAREFAYLQGEMIGNRLGRLDEGLAYAEVAWGLLGADPSPFAEAQVRTGLGTLRRKEGDLDEAEVHHRAALDLILRAEPESVNVISARTNIALLRQLRGDYRAAKAEQEKVLAYWIQELGEDHPLTVNARANLSTTLFYAGERDAAIAEQRRVLAIDLRNYGPEHPKIADWRSNLGFMLREQGAYAEAEQEQRAALALKEKLLEPEHPSLAVSYNNLGEVLHSQEKYAEAEAEHRRALALRLKVLSADHPYVALSQTNLARAIEAQGDASDEAIKLAETAYLRRSRDDVTPEHRGLTTFLLARLLWPRAEQRGRARTLAQEARDAYASAGSAYDTQRAEIDAWIAERSP